MGEGEYGSRVCYIPKSPPRLAKRICQPKGSDRLPAYAVGIREPRRAVGSVKTHHLNDLAESICMNAGGCCETEASDRPVKPQQRRSRHSSRRSGKPAAGRRAAGAKRLGVPLVGHQSSIDRLLRSELQKIPGDSQKPTYQSKIDGPLALDCAPETAPPGRARWGRDDAHRCL